MPREGRDQLIDPRLGDFEDDAGSPHNRSLLAIAGSMLVEINLVKLTLALTIMIFLPAILLGLVPLVVTGWYGLFSRQIAEILSDIVPLLTLVILLTIAWLGGRPLWRTMERSFWSLISLLVQPAYAIVREGLRHLGERVLPHDVSPLWRGRLASAATATAGLLLSLLAVWLVISIWPQTRWTGSLWDLRFPNRLVAPTLANSVFVVGIFLAAAALVWSLADALMEQPRDLEAFDEPQGNAKPLRVAHLSDLHAVGGPYEFRIESGRTGPQGNRAIETALARLAEVHAREPVDLVLISGDATDAGRAVEWAAFLEILRCHPQLAERCLLLPGNHDLNVVARTDPARLELPTGTSKCLREMRTLSALCALQGDRVLVMDRESGTFSRTLREAVAPHAAMIATFAERGGLRRSIKLGRLWDDLFPMVLPPQEGSNFGVILLNSNAETHFSFTNALGLVPATQAQDMQAATRQFPQASWIIGLHHHLMEYPRAGATLAARIGTALINGSSFMRLLRPLGRRVVAMHGHRHIDWVGICGPTRIISAPSPVMTKHSAHFHIHRMVSGKDGDILLLPPETVVLEDRDPIDVPHEVGDKANA
jgi:hypothetical protein